MPSQKLFDIDEALDRAANIFWSKGYQATSIADLVDGMSINKGSLYNAFGSKKELFARVLTKFERDNQAPTLVQLEALDDPVAAITALFDTVIAQSLTDAGKKGCLIINTALELPHHENDIRAIVCSAVGKLEAFFRHMIVLGQEGGSIAKAIKADDAAKSLVALTVGIRVLARGAFDATELIAIKSSALKLIGK